MSKKQKNIKKLLNNVKNGCSTVKKPKNVKAIYVLKKPPVKYEMPKQKGVCGIATNPALQIPAARKKDKYGKL